MTRLIGETSNQMMLRMLSEAWTEHEGPRGGTYYVKDGDEATKTYTRPSNMDGGGDRPPAGDSPDAGKRAGGTEPPGSKPQPDKPPTVIKGNYMDILGEAIQKARVEIGMSPYSTDVQSRLPQQDLERIKAMVDQGMSPDDVAIAFKAERGSASGAAPKSPQTSEQPKQSQAPAAAKPGDRPVQELGPDYPKMVRNEKTGQMEKDWEPRRLYKEGKRVPKVPPPAKITQEQFSEKINGYHQQYKAPRPTGENTSKQYTTQDDPNDPSVGDFSTVTPERKALHDSIVKEIVSNAQSQPEGSRVFTVMGGGPASGKSTVLNAGMVQLPPGTVTVDPDEIKMKLPEMNTAIEAARDDGANNVHEESSYLAKEAMKRLYASGSNLCLDGTGDNSLKSLKKKTDEARAAGYKVKGMYVTCPTELAMNQGVARGNGKGRYLTERIARDTHSHVSKVLPDAVKAGVFDDCQLWDTEGDKPVLVMSSVGTNMQIHDQEAWDRFLAKSNELPQKEGSSPAGMKKAA